MCDRSRTHNQIHAFNAFLRTQVALVEHHTQRLQRLPETHVVTQRTVQVVLAQGCDPRDALFLVIPQCGMHWDG